MLSLITYILGGAAAVALSEFSKTKKMANGGGIEQFPPKGELKNRDNLLLKYEKIGDDYEFYVFKPIEKDVSSYKQTTYVCENKDCPAKMSYKQFINYLYAETYLDDRKMSNGGRVRRYPNLEDIKYDEVVNDDSKKISINEIDIVKKDIVPLNFDTKIGNSKDASRIFYEIWDKNSLNVNENAYILFLSKSNNVKSYYFLSKGGIDGTIMDVELISALAVKTLSKGVILAHNHPSGNLMPSDADIKMSRQVKDALRLFNILLIDSLILTPSGQYTSLVDEGRL